LTVKAAKKKTDPSADRRVQRTRRALGEALVELILERGWAAVSVQDVCDRADIGRSTFYSHFADKEDLLIGGLDDLGQAVRGLGSVRNGDPPLAFVRGVIEHAMEQRPLFRAVIGKHGGHLVQLRFREMLMGLFAEELTALAPTSPQLGPAIAYVAGAFSELLIWWLETRSSLDATELEQVFHRMATPVVDQLRGLPKPSERGQ